MHPRDSILIHLAAFNGLKNTRGDYILAYIWRHLARLSETKDASLA